MLVALVVVSAVLARPALGQASVTQQASPRLRNPHALRAMEVLERRAPATTRPVIRFEWDQVRGAREYLLIGHWMQQPSWTMQSKQLRVSRGNATSWSGERVTFEIALPQGSHSWRVVALFGPRNVGDSANATPYAFDVR